MQRFKKKGYIVYNKIQLKKYLNYFSKFNVKIMMQEIIPGPEENHVFLDGYFSRDSSPKALFVRERIKMWPKQFGNSSSCKSVRASKYDRLKKILFTLLMACLIAVSFCAGAINNAPIAQASLLDIIQALVAINPLELTMTAPPEAVINEAVKIEVVIKNKGEEKIDNIQAEIFLPEGLVLITKKQIYKIGAIPPLKEKKTRWLVKGEKSGEYIILVSVKGKLGEHEISSEESTVVAILNKADTARLNSPQSFHNLWQGLLNFFKNWLKTQ